MADAVVGIDVGVLLFLLLLGGSIFGVVAYSKFNQYLFGKHIKNEIRSELLDKEQTKEIKRLEREIDKIQTK